MLKFADMLTVEFRGRPIGRIFVDEPYPTRFFGIFQPGPGFSAGQHLFDEVTRLSRELAQAAPPAPEHEALKEREKELIQELTASVRLPELLLEIEEFDIDHSGEVEVTLKLPCD